MSSGSQDPRALPVAVDWQPRSLRACRSQRQVERWKVVAFVLVAGLHGLVIQQLLRMLAPRPADDQVTLVLDFTPAAELESSVPAPPPEPSAAQSRQRERRPPRNADSAASRRPSRAPDLQALPEPEAGAPLRLYNPDGSLRVPDDILDQLDGRFGDKRTFSYQIPRMDDAAKYFDRNPPVTYESTRFDQYWKPDQDLLTELLTTLVEKTTTQIKVPVPGSPGSTMICQVSILAFGGGCGVLTEGADYVGPVDDPDTLSPEEDRQCQAWWEQITGTNTQDAWRRTRSLYEQQCRKPLLRLPPTPP